MVPASVNPPAPPRVLRERYHLDAPGWAVLQARLRALRSRGAIIGPPGSGKTTLLEDLAERLTGAGRRVTFVRLHAGVADLPDVLRRPALARLGPPDALLLDGAGQLSWWRWQCLRHAVRNLGVLVVTAHAPGRLPTLWRCTTSPQRLRELVQALGDELDEAAARELFARHRGNLRLALREWQDGRVGVG